GRDVLCDALEVVGLEPGRARGEVRFRIDHQLGKIGFVERLDPGGKRSVAQNKNRRAVLARDAGGFNRDVKTIFNRGGGEHDTRTIAVAAEDRLMQIALLDVGRQTGAWRSEEHTSELQSRGHLVCRLLLEKKKKKKYTNQITQQTINSKRY